MIKPLYNYVLLKKIETSNKTKSGIILTQKEQEEDFAIVESIGEFKEITINNTIYNNSLKKGDKVIYKKYSGTEFKENDKEYILIKAEDILAIIK